MIKDANHQAQEQMWHSESGTLNSSSQEALLMHLLISTLWSLKEPLPHPTVTSTIKTMDSSL